MRIKNTRWLGIAVITAAACASITAYADASAPAPAASAGATTDASATPTQPPITVANQKDSAEKHKEQTQTPPSEPQQPPRPTAPPQPDPHALQPLRSWSAVQSLFLPEGGKDGNSVQINLKQGKDFSYTSAWISGRIFTSFKDCGPGKPLADPSKELQILVVDNAQTENDKGETLNNQGFAINASQALIDCMNYAKQTKRTCNSNHPCDSAKSLGAEISNLQEGDHNALSFCYPDKTKDADPVCEKPFILTPAAELQAADKKAKQEAKAKKDEKEFDDLDSQRLACEKSLKGGNLEAFAKLIDKTVAEDTFLNSHKAKNPALTKKAQDFDKDELLKADFKTAIAAASEAADPKNNPNEMDKLRKQLKEIVDTKLEADDSDEQANHAYSEDVLKVYDKISNNYLEHAKTAADQKTFNKLIAAAEDTYKEAKKESIFDSEQKDSIQKQLDLYVKLKEQVAASQRNLPGNPGNAMTDNSLLAQLNQDAVNANCGGAGITSLAIAQASQAASNPNMSMACVQAGQNYAAGLAAMLTTCQNAKMQAYYSGTMSTAYNQCAILDQQGYLAQAYNTLAQAQSMMGRTPGGNGFTVPGVQALPGTGGIPTINNAYAGGSPMASQQAAWGNIMRGAGTGVQSGLPMQPFLQQVWGDGAATPTM